MTHRSRPSTVEWWRLLLAAIAAALATLLGAGTASAATGPVPETRVGASPVATQTLVGPHESITAGQRWGHAPPQADPVVATGVAAKSVDEVADIGHAGLRHQFPNTLPRKSQFYDDIDLGALSSRTKGLDGIVQPNGNTRYLLRNSGGAGVDRTTGLPTDVYTVIRRPDGSVVTMFPGTSPKG